MLHEYHYDQDFKLENDVVLKGLTVAYCTYGTLNEQGDNVIWIGHALTANADASDWWNGMIGPGATFDTDRYFVVCANILGSCYGTTGPLSINPATGIPYFHSFPFITIRDMVSAHIVLADHLQISRIALLVGGSMGGYQAMEWALQEPQRVSKLILLVTSPAESAWGIAIHTAQRLAIEADATWADNSATSGAKGLKAARAIGMLTYRNYQQFVKQQTDHDSDKTDDFKAASYINYQGEKLVRRFNAYSYWTLSKAMDSHNIARGRGGNIVATLKTLQQPVLLIGISSDLLCPPEEQRFMAAHLPDCDYIELDSPFGHDGFLVESAVIGGAISQWVNRHE